MAGVVDYCQGIADKLVAANIRAVTDPANVSPPCVLVVAQEGEMTTLDGVTSSARFTMHLIGPGQGAKNSMDALSSLFARVIKANVAPVVAWRLTSYDTDNGAPYPAYDLDWIMAVDVTQGVTP
jgi:hypothetical protein